MRSRRAAVGAPGRVAAREHARQDSPRPRDNATRGSECRSGERKSNVSRSSALLIAASATLMRRSQQTLLVALDLPLALHHQLGARGKPASAM